MDLTYATIAVLACMIFVLAGMVGYLYWQQTHMLQQLQSLAIALASHIQQTRLAEEAAVAEEEVENAPVPVKEEEVDDRVSVEHVAGPPPPAVQEPDVDDIHTKTSAQLREILTKKGIPFGKRDSKNVLLELLKASS
jgi:hypothetical protein